MDGTIIETSKGVPGVNIPPMHPFCRSIMIPLFDEDIDETMMKRERDPKTGKNRFVRANKTYDEWYKEYVESKNSQSLTTSKKDNNVKNETTVPKIINLGSREKKKTEKQFIEYAIKNERILDKYVPIKSKWKGKINIDTREYSAKEWDCSITLLSDSSIHELLHEQLHARSVSYYDKNTYLKNKKIEEASVQFLTREISKKENIKIKESQYDYMVKALEQMNDITHLYKDNLTFAIELFKKPLPERLDWLDYIMHDIIIREGDFKSMGLFSDLIDLFYE